MGISFFHKRTFVFNTKFALRLFSIQSFSINLYSAKDILNTMIDDVPCFKENQTLSASLVKSTPHNDPSPQLLCISPAPSLLQAQRILPHTRWEPLGKRAIVSWEGLHLEKPEGLGPQVSPSHLAKSSWKEDLLCARASPECREEMSLNVPSRGNCTPKRVTSPQIGLLDSNTNTTKSQPTALLPTERGKTCTWKMLGSLGTWGFCSFLSQGFPSPPFFVPILCPWPHSMALGKLSLHTTLPIYLGPGHKGNRRGFWVDHSWGNREPWKLPRMPRVRVGLFLSGMTDAHAHAHTHTPSLWHLHTHPHTQEMIGFVKTHCST